MASTSKARRTRPEGGGIVWHERLNAFECLGCGEWEEIRAHRQRTPDRLAALREMLIADHTECWEFDDPRMARDARRYRKERKRRDNLSGAARTAGDLSDAAIRVYESHGKGEKNDGLHPKQL